MREAKAWLECRLLKHEELFGYDLIFGRVLLAYKRLAEGYGGDDLMLLEPIYLKPPV